MADIRTVGIIGAGVIGRSFTALYLAHGLKVLVFVSDASPSSAQKLQEYIERAWVSLEAQGLREGASPKKYEILSRVADMEKRLGECDFVQECGPESLQIKMPLFAAMDACTPPTTILASATSGFPSSTFITQCAAHPERILIVHPFNPPHMIPLVEVVPHPGTSEDVVQRTSSFLSSLGRKPVVLTKEVPGFVANRLQCAVFMEAFSLVKRGVVTAEELDLTMTEGLGLRWALTGPFMTGLLGGGGNPGGLERLSKHLGPGLWYWTKDMNENSVFLGDPLQELAQVVPPIARALAGVDTQALEKERDELVVEILRLKRERETLK